MPARLPQAAAQAPAKAGRRRSPPPAAAETARRSKQKAAPSASRQRRPAASAAAPAAAASARRRRVFASPLARRIAKDAGIDVAAVSGSGPHGRVVKADVEAAIAGGGAKAAPAAKPRRRRAAAPAAAPRPMSDEAVLKLFEPGSYELVPHDSMRKTIARRLVEAKQTIPHFYLTLDCELDALLALRAQLNAAAPVKKTDKGEVPAYKLSVNDLVIKALALALRDVPDANVSWTDSAHGQAQACRCRRRRVDPGRPDHADHPQRRREDAVGDLQRDEGPRRRAPATAS